MVENAGRFALGRAGFGFRFAQVFSVVKIARRVSPAHIIADMRVGMVNYACIDIFRKIAGQSNIRSDPLLVDGYGIGHAVISYAGVWITREIWFF